MKAKYTFAFACALAVMVGIYWIPAFLGTAVICAFATLDFIVNGDAA